ncbi:hypothetical protein F5Y00DRAFT_68750 [Daldinia vernicosa]|uniref:uncharacterized protein n=1 Tax=Daldinia vernicosa TaxID=114800 RepID=UPI0020081061|nr:uncharacterized protein F5Y00DRAFT_68750 [Daldinia vernicosa]KAI0849219.1 hypothetical protein F5Y00DRAFT_68750 [Daldinia vernicosa]
MKVNSTYYFLFILYSFFFLVRRGSVYTMPLGTREMKLNRGLGAGLTFVFLNFTSHRITYTISHRTDTDTDMDMDMDVLSRNVVITELNPVVREMD